MAPPPAAAPPPPPVYRISPVAIFASAFTLTLGVLLALGGRVPRGSGTLRGISETGADGAGSGAAPLVALYSSAPDAAAGAGAGAAGGGAAATGAAAAAGAATAAGTFPAMPPAERRPAAAPAARPDEGSIFDQFMEAAAAAGAAAAAAAASLQAAASDAGGGSSSSSSGGSAATGAAAAAAAAPATALDTVGAADAGGFARVVDGLSGPPVQLPWVPRRTSAALALGDAAGSSATLIVDSWWGSHHSRGSAGAEPLAWSSLSEGSPLLGGASAAWGAAPPLPTCRPLGAGDVLDFPEEIARNADFPDYEDMAAIVDAGGVPGGWQSLVGSAGAAAPSDPAPRLRHLLWHRIAHNASGDFIGADAGARDMLYAGMTERSRGRYCAVGGRGINPDFRPRLDCDGATAHAPSVRYPYCNRATAPVAVVSFDCAVVESGAYNPVIVFNVLSFDAGGRVVTYNYHKPHAHPRWALPPVPVREFEELATVGTSVYPDAPGHLFNEILPRLIHMDAVLPLRIPLLWPPGALPARVLDALRDNGLISRARAFVAGTGGADLFRAKRLYVYTSDYYSGHTPLILATSQRVLAARLQRLAERKAAAAPPPAPPLAHGGIVLLMRNGGEARAVQNSDELLARLAAQHPGVKIDAFVPGSPGRSYVECAGAVYGARVIIGPHGANLNNFVGARPGATVIEIGYADDGNPLPSDYFCQARNLGLKYWLSMADYGSYGAGITVNIDDILEITRGVFAAPAA